MTRPSPTTEVAVTGAANGLGRRIAIEAAARGATRLWLIDHDGEGLAALDDELPPSCDVRPRTLDVGSRPAVAELGREWKDEAPPGLLVNAAGIRHAAAIGETTDDDWDDTLAVNLTGVFMVTRAAVVALRHHDLGGVVVNLASVAGDVGFTERAAYCASKAGVLGLTRAAALDLAPHGIRVFAVSPGFHASGISDDLGDDLVTATVPLGRRGDPAELARLVHDIADASFVTGANIVVDGGSSIGTNFGPSNPLGRASVR